MISVASYIAQSGYPEYYDYIERYIRNQISQLQFVVTPEFEKKYRDLHKNKPRAVVNQGFNDVKKFQGGFYNGGLDDFENSLLGGGGYIFKLAGCCSPEGMRAVYTAWINTISRQPETVTGPAGVYVNMSLSRDSEFGEIISYVPEAGRLTVKSKINDRFFVRPPHWIDKNKVSAFINAKPVPVVWSNAYVQFDAKPGDELTITYLVIAFTHHVSNLWENTAPGLEMMFKWIGNRVVSAEPVAEKYVEQMKKIRRTKLYI
jgi:hypothetical protein